MTARPPPRQPETRGELRMEKFGGVRLLSTEGRVSRGSQVSDRDSMSSLWSEIVSWIEVGLSSWGVTDVADLMFRWERLREVRETGPGFISMSPARRRIKQNRKNLGLFG